MGIICNLNLASRDTYSTKKYFPSQSRPAYHVGVLPSIVSISSRTQMAISLLVPKRFLVWDCPCLCICPDLLSVELVSGSEFICIVKQIKSPLYNIIPYVIL